MATNPSADGIGIYLFGCRRETFRLLLQIQDMPLQIANLCLLVNILVVLAKAGLKIAPCLVQNRHPALPHL